MVAPLVGFHPYRPTLIVDAGTLWRLSCGPPCRRDIDAAPNRPSAIGVIRPAPLQQAGPWRGRATRRAKFRLGPRPWLSIRARGDAITPAQLPLHLLGVGLRRCGPQCGELVKIGPGRLGQWPARRMMSPPSSSAPTILRAGSREYRGCSRVACGQIVARPIGRAHSAA